MRPVPPPPPPPPPPKPALSKPTAGRSLKVPEKSPGESSAPAPSEGQPTSSEPPVRWFRSWLGQVRRRAFSNPASGVLVSFVVHTVALVSLALFVHRTVETTRHVTLFLADRTTEFDAPLDATEPVPFDLGPEIPALEPSDLSTPLAMPEAPDISAPVAGQPDFQLEPPPVPARDWRQDASLLMERTSVPTGGGLEGRTAEARSRLVVERGGTEASENAVGRALEWLAAHQRPDGGWRFSLEEGPCQGRCQNSGSVGTTTGATGLALLPFLGAGHTTKDGEYAEVVRRGVYYLTSRILETRHGADLQEGTMYAQGIATLALCEAYGMSRDEDLREPAQRAIDFICSAQHPKGGWRYTPGEPGDTTVFSWQFMALKSARLAGLDVPSPVIERAKGYLDGVQTANGAYYGYIKASKEPAPTAIGLLSRMYTGWGRDDERLKRGVDYLSVMGPSRTDVYFDYYATQVMHHYGGPEWERWNLKMREHLIRTQARNDHQAGSWFFSDRHGTVGGRLYTTAMCAMILEVYYRYMPLYGEGSIEDSF